ncbi:MAG: hypothetical protein C5B48_04475 [Candidatus Rokuibacteriota bacterium]|nr:MAG: hypothetical protein C5B48_04475 [Candidatus Rokubacteria bacterium]
MTVTAPPHEPESEQDRDLEQRVADLEALIEEARRRARRRRVRSAAAFAVAAGAAVVGLIGFHGGGGGGTGTAAPAGDSAARREATKATPPFGPLPAGHVASAFAFDRRRSNVVYIASRDARDGVYVLKTTDNGQHWHMTGARGTGWMSDVLSLTSDPQHSGTLYAGTDTAVYKTVNGGRTWVAFNQGLFPPDAKRYGPPGTTKWFFDNGWVLDMAVDPADSNVVYSAAGAVRKSVDGGHSWKSVLLPYPFLPRMRHPFGDVTRIAIAPTRPESIYAIAHGFDRHGAGRRTTIYKSTDAGRHWHLTGGPAATLPPSCCGDTEDALAVDPRNPQTLYAAVGSTVLATTDGGASWHSIAKGLPARDVTSLAVDPQRSGTIYAGVWIDVNKAHTTHPLAGAIYRTTDGGQTWSEVFHGFAVEKVAIDIARPSTIYAAGRASPDYHFRLLRSTDSGRTWATAP